MPSNDMIVYATGQYVRESEAAVPVLDHGFLYGDGVWDGMRVYGGKVFRLEEHITRLYELAHACAIEIPMTSAEMTDVIAELLARNSYPSQAYIRPVVTRGPSVGLPGLDSETCQPRVYILIHHWRDVTVRPVRMKIVALRRRPPECLPVAKTLSFMDNKLARIEARRTGADDALLLDVEGNITEAAGSNLFLVKDGQLLTSHARRILAGVTRGVVLEIAAELGISVAERDLSPAEAYRADEAFLTSTGGGIVPVASIDEHVMLDGSPGPTTARVAERYQQLVGQ